MINNKTKVHRVKRHQRIRAKISGTSARPRVAVFRSNKYLLAQAVDDDKRVTIVSERGLKTKSELMAEQFAKKLQAAGITQAVFDRGGYRYHGHIKTFAEGLRKTGITI